MTAAEVAGWLPCGDPQQHRPHAWTYTDPATHLTARVHCDGATQPEPESPCCGDPLCPCRSTTDIRFITSTEDTP